MPETESRPKFTDTAGNEIRIFVQISGSAQRTNSLRVIEALQVEHKLGVLLPCNVIVRDAGGGRTEVAAIDPVTSMDRTGNPKLAAVAEEVRVRLQRAVEHV